MKPNRPCSPHPSPTPGAARRGRGAAALPFALITAAMVGCTDAPSQGSGGAEAATASGADLVSSLEAGTMSGAGAMSGAPGAAGAGAGPQEIDIASLGYNDGPGDAPVRVLEFSDFGCGYCRRFHEESYPVLVREYMDAGKVEWKYVPMILGMFPNAMEAARAGECAGEQGEFAVMRDLLFERQSDWKRSDDPEPLMEGYARELGLDVDRFGQCVGEGWRDDRIQAGTQLSRQVGVRGTPTFFVVGYAPIPGAIPLDLFRTALDTVYAEAMRESEGG